MIITLSGKPGSGKSTVGKLLAKKLSYKFYSMGDVIRKYAAKQKITLENLQEKREKDLKWDYDIDNHQTVLGKTDDNFIIDSRLSWHFIPNAIKIFLEVTDKISAERVFKDQRSDEKKYSTVKELMNAQKKREKEDVKQLKKLYDVDFTDKKNYDLIIDTSKLTPDEIVEKILFEINKYNI